jgi:phage shock protein PspC (stress-responsive transcriptional regulator)
MKKTVTVNLNGRVFTMDEDAYRLMDSYLENLRIYFRKEEGSAEIIADFEARIEELFSERVRRGYEVITIEHVEEVITRVGKPADFSDKEESEEEEEKQTTQTTRTEYKETKKKFHRNVDDKMFGGICSGISAYFGWDVLAIRIISVILIFVTSAWIVPVYLLAWVLFPGAYTAEQKLQMRGRPITVENIGKTVAADAEAPIVKEKKGCLAGFVDLIVGLMKVFLVGVGCLVGFPVLFVVVIVLVVLFAVLFGVGGGMLGLLPLGWTGSAAFLTVSNPVLATSTFIVILAIPIIALIYSIISYLAKLKPINNAVKWVFFGIWILALALFLCSGFKIKRDQFYNNLNNWSWHSGQVSIVGNGILSEKEYVISDPFDYVELNGDFVANLQIEQSQSDSLPSITVSADENLIDMIKYRVESNNLYIYTQYTYHLKSDNNMIIKVKTPNLKGVKTEIFGNILINKPFVSEEFEVRLSGAGKFQADSLDVKKLKASSEGIGSIVLSGKAKNATFSLEGAGGIYALDLLSDSVFANVDGIGSIKCNPTEYLKGDVNGIGQITYKEEPKNRNTGSVGIGKIGKENN